MYDFLGGDGNPCPWKSYLVPGHNNDCCDLSPCLVPSLVDEGSCCLLLRRDVIIVGWTACVGKELVTFSNPSICVCTLPCVKNPVPYQEYRDV
jgi:hypothetical protein